MLLKKARTCKSTFAVSCFLTTSLAITYLLLSNLPPRGVSERKILIWDAKDELFNLKLFETERECDYVCSYTTPQDKHHDVSKYDGVIFGRTVFKDSEIPGKFSPAQKYVFLSLERPEDNHISEKFDDAFDMVVTYRSDSDIFVPRFHVIDREKNVAFPSEHFQWKLPRIPLHSNFAVSDGKIKFAAYVSSNDTLSDAFVEEMREFIEVDVYPYDANIYSELKNEYYFYFALDDRFCVDYLPKGIGEAVLHDTIPIVKSGTNGFLPMGSFIDAEGFSSEDLAKKMEEIVKYREEYLKYFWWKSYYDVVKYVEGKRTPLCQLCKMLHDGFVNKRKFVKWWIGSEADPVCKKSSVGDTYYDSS